MKGGRANRDHVKIVIQFIIFPFRGGTADWVKKFAFPEIEGKYQIRMESNKSGKTFAHEILNGIGDSLKIFIRSTTLRLQRVVIYER